VRVAKRKPIMAGNWKMNLNHLGAIALVQKLHYMLKDEVYDEVDVVVCPPFTALRAVQTLIDGENSRIILGAQDCHWEDKGAFTGDVSASMLARLKVSYVIVGHSERRGRFWTGEGRAPIEESDEIVNRKAKAVFAKDMTPIVCVGESLAERQDGRTEDVVTGQVRASMAGLTSEQLTAAVVAYEPVWAIGTGETAQPEDADQVCGLVRQTLKDMGADADAARIQYGGSMNAGNVKDLMAKPNIDGGLVGGASIKLDADGSPTEFALVVRHRD
jgi:triosephosphate isomerase